MVTRDDLEFIRECDEIKVQMLELLEAVRDKTDCRSWKRLLSKETYDRMKEFSDLQAEQFERKVFVKIEENEARRQRILKDIAVLPSVERDVIRMRYQKGWSWQRIVEEMHYSETNVFRIHKRALERLAEEITDPDPDHDDDENAASMDEAETEGAAHGELSSAS